MKLMVFEPIAHRLIIGNTTIFPETVSVFRKDTCHEIQNVDGGILLCTSGSRGVELLVTGSYSPDEKEILQGIIESFVSDVDSVSVDGRDYGAMIMLESALTEKTGEIGGRFRFRFGGLELIYDRSEINAMQSVARFEQRGE